MKQSTLATLLLIVLIGLSGCVTIHGQDGSKTVWNPLAELLGKGNADRVEIYTPLNDPSWWALWKSMRDSPAAMDLMRQDRFRIKFFPTSEASVVPLGHYEVMVAHDRERAYSFLDFLSADSAVLNKDGMRKRHTKMNAWIERNWPGGGDAFMRLLKREANARFMGTKAYMQEFNALGVTGNFPAIIVNGKEDQDYLRKLMGTPTPRP